jgi:ABC-type lipopolysaccharide export system ATPase subunit
MPTRASPETHARLGTARTFQVPVLDEPSLGLAPAVVETLYETLGRLRREGLALLLAEQAVELALEVADCAYVLQTGRTVLQEPYAHLADEMDVQRIYPGAGDGGTVGGGVSLACRKPPRMEPNDHVLR